MRGFSLVELSIVLVILGLLVGGVLAGQSLIRAAELRSVATEYERYATAVTSFRHKYFALPGDMLTATNFWGQATNCSTTNAANRGGALAGGTCNGDGDGFIVVPPTMTEGGAATTGVIGDGFLEGFRAWHHLAKAGLVERGLSGQVDSAHYYLSARAGWNVPPAKLKGAAWCFGTSSTHWFFAGDFTNSLTLGGVSDRYCDDYVLRPTEAWYIDAKLDDGMPARGRVKAMNITRCTDAWTTVTALDALYSTRGQYADEISCKLNFKL